VSYTAEYLAEVAAIAAALDQDAIDAMADILHDTLVLRGSRVFVLGVGGSAANASHLVNDLRKIVDIEAYAPTDNVAELTARTNDDGWHSTFTDWLAVSELKGPDVVMVLSVGGGSADVSPNIVSALTYAREQNARIIGIVGRSDGYTAQVADVCIVVPNVNDEHVTPHAESFQSVIGHLLVWHPLVRQ
jgi:D-sedoheptulose 7-phosphate isomerase